MKRPSPSDFGRYVPIMVAVIFVVVCASQLLRQPVTGLADNGDYLRLMVWLGLKQDPSAGYHDLYFGYYRQTLLVDAAAHVRLDPSTPVSGEVLVGKLAVWLDEMAKPDCRFDLLTLGLIRVVLLALPVYLLTLAAYRINPRLVLPVGALVTLMLSDRTLLVYYNSLFTEPGSVLGLALVLGAGLNLSIYPTTIMWLLYALGCTVLGTAKLQNVPCALLFSFWGVSLALRSFPKKRLAIATVTLFMAAGLGLVWSRNSEHLQDVNRYNAVFNGVLLFAANPNEALADLEGGADLAVFAGTDAYADGSGRFLPSTQQMLGRITLWRLAAWYLRHPDALWRALEYAASHAFEYRPDDLGNWPKAHAPHARAQDFRWTAWSQTRSFVPASLLTLLIAAGAAFAVILRLYARARLQDRRIMEIFVLCAASAAIQIVGTIVGDGITELIKHLFFFNICFDACLIMALAWCINARTSH